MRLNTEQYAINFGNKIIDKDGLACGEMLAGGGGWTSGLARLAGCHTVWILNHDTIALKVNSFNNEGVKVYWADLYVQDEKELEQVDMIHVSLECDQHSKANAGKKKKLGSYMMGWEFYRYAKYLLPLVITVENVPEFKKWAPLDENGDPDMSQVGKEFEKWRDAIMALGYEYKESIRNAADDGMPTRRVRYFGFFYRPGIDITIPDFTHSEKPHATKKKWNSCRQYINTEKTGPSIFGREFNEDLMKIQRKPLCKNSLKRIAGGIKKFHPEVYQFLAHYHAGENPERFQSLLDPIATIDSSNRHQLITLEKLEFIMDHCRTDNYNKLEDPLNPILIWQTKNLVTVDPFIMDHCHSDSHQDLDAPLDPITSRQTKQIVKVDEPFITQYYGGSDQYNALGEPINCIPSRDTHQLVRLEKAQFLARYFNAGGNPESQGQSLDEPLQTVMPENKSQLATVNTQFIAEYYNSNGNPERNVHSLDEPLSPVMGEPKHQLITLLDKFDIKARFLEPEELAGCSTFDKGYFTNPELKLSHKHAIGLIGNAIPPFWAEVLVGPNIGPITEFKRSLEEKLSA